MEKYNVIKYGGSNLVDADAIMKMISFIEPDVKTIFVVSAMKDVTNRLEQVKQANDTLESIMQYHDRVAFDLGLGVEFITNKFIGYLEYDTQNMRIDLLQSLGELFSANIIYGFLQKQSISVAKSSDPLMRGTPEVINVKQSLLSVEEYIQKNITAQVHVIEGYTSLYGDVFRSNIGREGSDLTGVIVAKALDTDLILIKDVGGLYEEDPKRNSNAKLISEISISDYLVKFPESGIIYQRAADVALQLKVGMKIKGEKGNVNTVLYSY